jgi:hypothetical protein
MNAFCRHCGQGIHVEAVTCPNCGGAQQAAAAPATAAPDGPIWLPITSLVLGLVGGLALFDESDWDRNTTLGVGMIGLFALALGVISIKEQKTGRGMGIAGVVLACLTLLTVLGLLAS